MAPTTRLRAWAAPSPRLTPRLTAVLVLSVATTLVGSGLGTGPVAAQVGQVSIPAAAQATTHEGQDAEDGLRILLDEVSPVVLRPGQSVTLRGRVVNDGPDLSRPSLLTVAAVPSPLTSRAEVAGWVEGSDARPATWVLADDALSAAVPPGGEGEFEITVPGSSLESLTPTPAVLGVELVVSDDDEADRAPVPEGTRPTVLRTVLTSTGHPSVDEPLETAWVVPLTLPADQRLSSPDDTEHTAAWLAAVGQDSPIRRWLGHLTVPEVTWWVDPAALVAHQPAAALAVPAPEESEEAEESDPADDTGSEDDPENSGAPTDTEVSTAPAQTTGPTSPTPDPDEGRSTGDPEARTSAPDDETVTSPAPVPPPIPEPAPEPAPEPEGEVEDLDGALTQLRQTLAGVDPELLWWLPTDDPDLAVLADQASSLPTATVRDLLTRPPAQAAPEVTQLLRQGRHDAAWPALAAPTAEDVAAIATLFGQRQQDPLGAVLVPRETFTADSSAAPRLGAVPLRDQPDVVAIGADSWSSGLVAASGEHAQEHGAGAAAQRVLAHTLGTWLEAPSSPRALVIAPPRGTAVPAEVLDQLSAGWERARWLTTVSAQELLDRADDLNPVGLSGVAPQEEVLGPLTTLLTPSESPVTPSRATDLGRLQEDLDGLAQILRDTDALRSWEPLLDTQWSTRWRGEEATWVSTWRMLRQEVRSTRDAVYLLPSTINFLADQGVIHVTVVNDLPVAVDGMRLRLRPDNGRLQITGQPEPVDVGPGSRASVPFQARAITRGETVLTVRISTPNGTTLGEDTEVNVRVQPTGVWIYWVLGGLAGLVLVLGLRRALTSSPAAPAPAAPGSVPPPDGTGTAYPGSSPSPGSEEHPQ